MGLSAHLQKRLKQIYAASALIDLTYKGNAVRVKTDARGNAVLLFIGKRKEDGSIAGERYVRVLRMDPSGNVIKDHWDRKGKV